MNKQKPILFSTPMVKAILEGRKTQTRRVIKMQPGDGERYEYLGDHEFAYISHGGMSGPYLCPYGKTGDVLWVRETWQQCGKYFHYRADDTDATEKWKPSIFMPKDACRIFLQIINVRVERLQEISEEDAKAEGVEKLAPFVSYTTYFKDLWEKINGEKSWDANPWVWVVEFQGLHSGTTAQECDATKVK